MASLSSKLCLAHFQRERAEDETNSVGAGTPALDVPDESEPTKNVSAGTPLPNEPTDTFPQKRADALARMAEHYLATDKDGPVPLNGGDKYQVVVHINTMQVTRNKRQETSRSSLNKFNLH